MQNLWVGAHAYLRNQERGMPKHGTIAEINGTQIKVRRHLSQAQMEDDLIDDYGIYDVNDVDPSAPEWNDVAWGEDWDPIVVEEPHVTPTSIVTITQREDRYDNYKKPLLLLVNAEVHATENHECIKVVHSFARDEEGSGSRVFYADLMLTQFESSWGNQVTWLALMQQPLFFDPAGDSPWKQATREDDSAQGDYAANYGYPYTPPKARIAGHTFPMPVKITLRYGTAERLEKMLHRAVGLDDH